MRVRRLLGSVVAFGLVSFGLTIPSATAAVPSTFYVDCTAGSDTAAGSTPTSAWQSIVRANRAVLAPGDQLLFKRGCRWSNQRLDVTWSGAASMPVVLGAYGSGSDPVVHNGTNSNVKVTGSYLVIRDLDAVYDAVAAATPTVRTAEGCVQPVGNVYGFNFTDGANHVELRGSRAAGFTAGAHLSRQSHHITVVGNLFENNSIMERFGADPSKDLGAWGMNVNADDSEIAYNTFRNNRALCQNQGYKIASNSVELFEAQRDRIHHNRSYGDRVFSEIGGSADDRAADNVFAYNLMVSDVSESRFLVTRGGGSSWGPVWRTVATHNTVYLTGAGSQGVTCGQGCDSTILSMRSNVLWAEGKVLYADSSIDEGNNLYWSTNGVPTIQYTRDLSSSLVADPRFVNPANGNFRLRKVSPGVGTGTLEAGYATDLAGTPVPQGGVPEIGSFELVP